MLIIIIIFTTLAFGLFLFLRFSPIFGGRPDDALLRRMEKSPQYRNGIFENQTPTPMQSPEGPMAEAAKEYFKGGQERVPKTPPAIVKVSPDVFQQKVVDDVQVTWLGHSSVLIQIDGKMLLTDPMFGKRASPLPFLGPKRFNKALPLPSAEGLRVATPGIGESFTVNKKLPQTLWWKEQEN